ncbi:MAG TPA: RpiB/LacA/LacB family sugar-phosphate isomerase [Candidatus Limnocylindrales bacterium]|nr:RpiB/LacA/LacB family sugar-phosphate isomerase [Candidatus Limnocylindrales bacterium]
MSRPEPSAERLIVAFGSDHAGFDLKRGLMPLAEALGHEVVDLGNCVLDPQDDYPDFARAVGIAVATGEAQRAVLVCGSGVGASIAVNKVPGARGAVCHDTFSARQGVEDDDANVLVLGSRVIGVELAREVVRAFLAARFSHAERHERRLAKVRSIEAEASSGALPVSEVKK